MFLGNNDRLDDVDGLVQFASGVGHDIVELRDPFGFLARRVQADSLLFGSLCAPVKQSITQILRGGGRNKDQEGLRMHLADCCRALYVKPHKHVLAVIHGLQCLVQVAGGNALVVAVYNGVLDEFIVGDHPSEFTIGDKDIVYAVDFFLALGARGRCDDKVKGAGRGSGPLQERAYDRIFARA